MTQFIRIKTGLWIAKKIMALTLSMILFIPSPMSHAKPTLKKISIPETLGRIEESFHGSNGKTIIYIQDAHTSLEAQENIAEMIQHLVQKENVQTVFEEGYEGAFPTEKYFGSIQDPEVKRKLSYFLMDRLRLGGAEYAHINRKKDFRLIGADSTALHRQNLEWYRKNTDVKKKMDLDLKILTQEMRVLSDRYFSRELKQWIRLKEKLDAQELNLMDYLNRVTSLLKEKEISFKMPRFQNIHLLLTAAQSKDEKVIEASKRIKAKALFEEMDQLENLIAETYLNHERDQGIFKYYKDLQLIQRLSDIEITIDEFELAKKALQNFDVAEVAHFIARHRKKSIVLSKDWKLNIQNALGFYETAFKRDEVVATQLENFKKSDETMAVLVFGGFHKNKIREILTEKGFSFLVVMPKMTKIEKRHQDYYKRLMGVGHHPYEIPAPVSLASRTENSAQRWDVLGFPFAMSEVRTMIATITDFPNLAPELLHARLEQRLLALQLAASGRAQSEARGRKKESAFSDKIDLLNADELIRLIKKHSLGVSDESVDFDKLFEGEIPEKVIRLTGIFILRKIDGVWKVLFGKRLKKTAPSFGIYAVPAGKVDEGETFVQAVLRELEEETDIVLSEEDIHGRVEDFVGDKPNIYARIYVHVSKDTSDFVKTTPEMGEHLFVPLNIFVDVPTEAVGETVEEELRKESEEAELMEAHKVAGVPHLQLLLRDIASQENRSEGRVQVTGQEVFDALRAKYGMRNLLRDGPIRQPDFFAVIERDPTALDDVRQKYKNTAFEDRSYISQMADPEDVVTFETVAREIASGEKQLPLVYKPNREASGVGLFFIENDEQGNIVLTFGQNSYSFWNEKLELIDEHLKQSGRSLIKNEEKNVFQAILVPDQDDISSILLGIEAIIASTYAKQYGIYDSGMIETVMPVTRYQDRAYETRHRFNGNLSSGEIEFLKQNTGDIDTGWNARIGASPYFSNRIGYSSSQTLLHEQMYDPLFEIFDIPEESRQSFLAYVDDLVRSEFEYLVQRLKSAGVDFDHEVNGQFDLAWLSPNEAGGFPIPVLIEAAIHPTHGNAFKQNFQISRLTRSESRSEVLRMRATSERLNALLSTANISGTLLIGQSRLESVTDEQFDGLMKELHARSEVRLIAFKDREISPSKREMLERRLGDLRGILKDVLELGVPLEEALGYGHPGRIKVVAGRLSEHVLRLIEANKLKDVLGIDASNERLLFLTPSLASVDGQLNDFIVIEDHHVVGAHPSYFDTLEERRLQLVIGRSA